VTGVGLELGQDWSEVHDLPGAGRWNPNLVRSSQPVSGPDRSVTSFRTRSRPSGCSESDPVLCAGPELMAFFDSQIVQDEAKRLFGDYQQLMQLGSEYGKFDREGKKLYIDRMEDVMDRYRVFMKRFELSEDFQAKLTVEQLRTQLGQFGLTPETMFNQMHQTLERMKTQLEKEL
jgi:hypothetical protein